MKFTGATTKSTSYTDKKVKKGTTIGTKSAHMQKQIKKPYTVLIP